MTTLEDVQRQTRTYADAREKLAGMVSELNKGLETLKRDHLPGIKRALQRAAEREAELREVIKSAPDLFVKPKTLVMHGIKVGFVKGKGSIEFTDADQVVKLIKRKLPDLADVLIITDEKPSKAALRELSVQELKSIGCKVDETDDMVVIKPIDSDVDKLVTALLKGATEDSDAQA